jgi:putative nucleotidyltransferase with HDIG domain
MNSLSIHNSKARKEFSELSALAKLSEMMSSDITIQEFLQFCISSLCRELDTPQGALFLLNSETDILTIRASQDFDEKIAHIIQSLNDEIANWVIKEKEPLLIIDELQDTRITDKNVKSLIVAPLKINNKVIGLIYLRRLRPGSNYNAIDLELANIFASQAAFAIEISRLSKISQEKLHELNKLNKIGKLLTASFDIDQILKIIVNTIKDMINIEFGALLLLDEENKLNITLIVPRNLSENLTDQFESKMVETMNILTMDDIPRVKTRVIQIDSHDWKEKNKKIKNIDSIKSLITVPLIVRENIAGLLNVAHSDKNFFSKDNLRTLSTFATQISIALENAKAYNALTARIKEQNLLMEISKALATTLELDKVLEMVVKITADLLDIKLCSLRLYDKKRDEFIIKSFFGLSDKMRMNCRVKNNQGLIGHVFDTGKPIAVQDILAEKRIVHSSMLVEEGIKSLVAVPIAIKNTRLGVILGYSTKKRFFTDNEINLLNTIARQAAGAIENARLYTFMHENFLNTIKALSAAIDTKDHYTHGHSKNVMDYSAYIAAELGLSPVEVEIIRFAGLLHDIGKIGVSESILSKKSGLNDDEFAIISTHPRLGAMIMDSVDFLKKISPIAYHHHERWDGRGYPMGLKGEDIPLGARIISVADAFDAITSKRSYSDAQDDDFGLREIIKCSGTQFDPKIVDAFVKVMDKKNRGVLQTIEEQPFLLTRELMKELA